jgi:hypothetical protein
LDDVVSILALQIFFRALNCGLHNERTIRLTESAEGQLFRSSVHDFRVAKRSRGDATMTRP